MAKPCAVFWDIQNVGIPRGQSADSIINLIRSTIIRPKNLNEISFSCVCDVNDLQSNVGHELLALGVDIVHTYRSVKDSADMKILDLMRRFVKNIGQDCSIILLSGDADYHGTLNDLKHFHKVYIYLIRLAYCCSSKLDQISDSTFLLHQGVLKPVKTNGTPIYFITIENYPMTANINQVMVDLNAQAMGSIQNSSILYGDLVCIGFPSLWSAEKATQQLNGHRYHGHFLKAELIKASPLVAILRNIKVEKGRRPKTSRCEPRKLSFIRMNNSSDSVCTLKFIKFCVACTIPNSEAYILSNKSFFWIVFSYKSQAEECLQKLQILYPDAVISDPPSDLALPCLNNPYTVHGDEQIIEPYTPKRYLPNNMAKCLLNDPNASCDQVVEFLNNGSKMEEKARNSVNNVAVWNTHKFQNTLVIEQGEASSSNSEVTYSFMSGSRSFEESIAEEVEPYKPEIVSKDVPPESGTKDESAESESKPKPKRIVVLRGNPKRSFNYFNPAEILNCK